MVRVLPEFRAAAGSATTTFRAYIRQCATCRLPCLVSSQAGGKVDRTGLNRRLE
jgi:hypothetical protein